MDYRDNLKEYLINIKNNNFEIPKEVEVYDLVLNMMKNIGTIDSELRDNLIFTLIFYIIKDRKISNDEMKKLLKICLSEDHLFYKIGNIEDDSVFNRAFSVLVIDDIIMANNEEKTKFLNNNEIIDVYNKVLNYFIEEKDLRGYVNEKGWAHSVAHTADALCSLVKCECIKKKEIGNILKAIKEKVCVDNYTYINEEDERLTNIVVEILNRDIISNDEILQWIQCFRNVNYKGKYPEDGHLKENRKKFLRSLYFRLIKLGYDKKIVEEINTILRETSNFY